MKLGIRIVIHLASRSWNNINVYQVFVIRFPKDGSVNRTSCFQRFVFVYGGILEQCYPYHDSIFGDIFNVGRKSP